jgi:hypothetical protein
MPKGYYASENKVTSHKHKAECPAAVKLFNATTEV